MRKKKWAGLITVGAATVACLLAAQPMAAGAVTSTTMTFDPNDLLHYKPADGYVGDVHPYYENGTHYLFSLTTDGNFAPELATSTDLVNWSETGLTHTGAAPAQSYYSLGIVKDGSTYRSWYGNGTEMKSSQSSNLTSWSNASTSYDIPNNTTLFPAGARDPYVFWDPDVSKYRMVSTAYRTNQNWGIGTGMDVSIALTTSTSSSPNSWGVQEELIRYPNTGVPAANGIEPEVAQFFKIGDRWYLMTSFARQSIHFVGRATYFIGDAGASIDDVDWASKTPHYIDGEDIAAAQVYKAGTRTLFLGWIPQNATGDNWGGHLSLPREITNLTDGTLSVKLATDVGSDIRGTELWPGSSTAAITGQNSGWTVSGTTASFSGTAFATAAVPASTTSTDFRFTVNMAATTDRAGLLIAESQAGPYGIEVTLDKQNSLLRLRSDRTGSGGWQEYATTPVRAGDLSGNVQVRVITEGDMIELFVGDRYSLAARVPFDLEGGNIRLLTTGDATFTNVGAFELNR